MKVKETRDTREKSKWMDDAKHNTVIPRSQCAKSDKIRDACYGYVRQKGEPFLDCNSILSILKGQLVNSQKSRIWQNPFIQHAETGWRTFLPGPASNKSPFSQPQTDLVRQTAARSSLSSFLRNRSFWIFMSVHVVLNSIRLCPKIRVPRKIRINGSISGHSHIHFNFNPSYLDVHPTYLVVNDPNNPIYIYSLHVYIYI